MGQNFLFCYQIREDAIDRSLLPSQPVFNFIEQKKEVHKASALFEDHEEIKEDIDMHPEDEEDMSSVPPYIPLSQYLRPGWIAIPVQLFIRVKKQSYGWGNQTSKNENRHLVQRLFWVKKDENLF